MRFQPFEPSRPAPDPDAERRDALRADAMALAERGEFAAAARQLRRLTECAPRDAFAHALLALCQLDAGDPRAATESAIRAVELDEALPLGHWALGTALAERNRFAEATPHAERALVLDDDTADHHALVARLRAATDDWRGTLAASARGLAVDPDHVLLGNLRALALRRLGRDEEADRAVRAQLVVDPANAMAHAQRGWRLLDGGAHEEARAAFEEALRHQPALDWARDGLAAALKARHRPYRVALRWFRWSGEQSAGTRRLMLVGGFVGFTMLRRLADAHPMVAPLVWPVLVAYAAFLFLSWTADPVFDLLLLFDPEGRRTISRDRRNAALAVAACLTGAVLLGAVSPVLGERAGLAALLLTFIVIPVAGTFRASAGWPRTAMLAVDALLVAGAATTLALGGQGPFVVTLVGAVAGSWLARALGGIVPRH